MDVIKDTDLTKHLAFKSTMSRTLFLTCVGLGIVSTSAEGRHRAPVFSHIEPIRLPSDQHDENGVVDNQNLQGRRMRLGWQGRGGGGNQHAVTSSMISHLRPIADDDWYGTEAPGVDGSQTFYHTKRRGSKKRGDYYDDDYYNYVDHEDDAYYGDDYYYGEEGTYGKGIKGSKTGGMVEASKGSKKGSKKSKSEKKKIDHKLKAPGDEYDDDWMNPDHFTDDLFADDLWYTDTPSPSEVYGSQVPSMEGNIVSGSATRRGHGTPSPTISPGALPAMFTSRMGEGGGNVYVVSQASEIEGSDYTLQSSTFGVPTVTRELFPHDIQLKAHSPLNLQEYDSELFAETTDFLTPCLQRAYADQLHAYKLTVEYSDGPDASDAGVIITHMAFHVVISVVTDTLDTLKSISHESASKVVHSCFDGPQMYDYLGSLRRAGVQVNEIAFLDVPFRSPIFAASMSSGEGSSSTKEPKNRRSGLIATLTVGMVVLGAAFLVHRRGKLPAVQITTDKLGHFGASIRHRAAASKQRLGRVSKALKEKLALSSFGSSKDHAYENGSISDDSQGIRERTYSGSFRRYPPGGVRPAAIQKGPAFSKDFLKSPTRSPGNDTSTLSVGDDYNVPDEYDFQGSPASHVYGGRRPPIKQLAIHMSSLGDEFSMPDDYNTVNEDMSIYSRNNSSMMDGSRFTSGDMSTGGRKALLKSSRESGSSRQQMQRPNPFISPTARAPSSSGSDRLSPKDHNYLDEWSMASFTTSPSGATPPYRHWDDKKSSDNSPGSRLAMPRLS